ncbi:MAG: c-type cytochrome [Gammaproteobacteria bacterium]
MRVSNILTVVCLTFCALTSAAQAAGDIEAGATKAKGCTACHNAAVSLKGRGAEVIAAQSKAIRAGSKAHPPGLADLCDKDIEDIAAFLDGA